MRIAGLSPCQRVNVDGGGGAKAAEAKGKVASGNRKEEEDILIFHNYVSLVSSLHA
jgi:hypothetical protein